MLAIPSGTHRHARTDTHAHTRRQARTHTGTMEIPRRFMERDDLPPAIVMFHTFYVHCIGEDNAFKQTVADRIYRTLDVYIEMLDLGLVDAPYTSGLISMKSTARATKIDLEIAEQYPAGAIRQYAEDASAYALANEIVLQSKKVDHLERELRHEKEVMVSSILLTELNQEVDSCSS